MGLMDKVKAQATQLAQKTQEAAQEGKAKYDQAQANRRGDALLRQLGAAVYADRTGRGSADSGSNIDRLINDISAHEKSNGLNLSQQTVPSQGSAADSDSFSGQPTQAEGQGTYFTQPGDSRSQPYQDGAPQGQSFPAEGAPYGQPDENQGWDQRY